MQGVICWFADEKKQMAYERRLAKFWKAYEKELERQSKKGKRNAKVRA